MKSNFTAGRVDKFSCKAGKIQSIFWDAKTPGLGLRVTKNGARSFVFESRLHGRTLRLTIGDKRTWDIGTAQEEATRLKRLVDQGIDPREEQAEKRAKAEATRVKKEQTKVLVDDAWTAYIEHHKKRRKKSWGARHLADHVNLSQAGGQAKKRGSGVTVQGVLWPLLQMRIADIDADALQAWVTYESSTRPNNARQGFELFRAFWHWCASRPEYAAVVDVQAVKDKDVRAEVPTRKTRKHDVLQRAYLPSWFAAVRSLNNPQASAYLQALLLTGARREEMAALKWKDVDFQWGSMWLKDKVKPEGRKIPLTPYLDILLSALPRNGKWVFTSPTAASGRITDPRIPHNRALSVAGLEHVTLHGLRRSFASLAEWVEMPVGVVAQIMGHAPNATAEKHYIDRPLELLALWHGKYEAWILEQAKVRFKRPNGKTKNATNRKPSLRVVS